MSVTNHTITVLVDGVDKTSFLKKESLFIRFQLNKRANTAELVFHNYEPEDRAEVQVSINGVLTFGGYVTNKTAKLEGIPPNHSVTWSIECKDWSDIFETVTVSGNFVNTEDRQILINLFSSFLPFDAGFSFSSTRTLKLSCTIAFDNVTLKEAIDQLAKLSGANWFIKPNKDVYWFAPSLPDKVSFKISSTPDNTTSFGFLRNSLHYSLDSNTIINQVKVVNGYQSTGIKQTDIFTGNGTTKTFVLTSKADTILFVGFNDGIGNYVTYGSFVGVTPDKLVSQGGTKRVIFNPTDNSINIEGNSGLAPANGLPVTVEYYYKDKVTLDVEDPHSVEDFGAYPFIISNKEFETDANLESLALSLLDQNSYAKPTIRFDTTQYGLLPGQLIELDIPELGLESPNQINRLAVEDRFAFLLENNDYLLNQQTGVGRSFLIQEVSITPVYTPSGFMIVSQITCGKYTGTLVDSLSALQELKSSTPKTSQPLPTRLSNYSSDLGEVVVGRATFTDGGTAQFNWGTPNGASGVVVGLEDTANAYGAIYVYHGGTVKAKLGNMTGMPMIGTITPSGWGLYTENGYFTGVVAASKLIGGTVSGSFISGGTISGNQFIGGTITGQTINGGTINSFVMNAGTINSAVMNIVDLNGVYINAGVITATTLNTNLFYAGTVEAALIRSNTLTGNTIIGGTIATGTPPINSSNPGVIMDSTGLYGYGTAGLSFRLSTNPAITPYFSSGTITNATYEVTTQSVIRTGITNPRIQIDNSGIFAYNSGGSLRFSVDTATGNMTANSGNFSGSVTASTITGNSISGGTITGALIQGNTVSGGTVTGSLFTGGTVSLASGTVTLDNSGLRFLQGGGSFSQQSSLIWQRSGVTSCYITTLFDGSSEIFDTIAGVQNSRNGLMRSIVYGNTTHQRTELRQSPTNLNFWNVTSGGNIQLSFNVNESEIGVYRSIVPWPTYNANINLGSVDVPFKYLYLKSPDNNVWRLEINNSGVVTVTDV